MKTVALPYVVKTPGVQAIAAFIDLEMAQKYAKNLAESGEWMMPLEVIDQSADMRSERDAVDDILMLKDLLKKVLT